MFDWIGIVDGRVYNVKGLGPVARKKFPANFFPCMKGEERKGNRKEKIRRGENCREKKRFDKHCNADIL